MQNDDIRYQVMNNLDAVRMLVITHRQKKILDFVAKNEGVVSRDIVKEFGNSIQAATAALCSLYKMGYLDRENVGHSSGGSEFLYKSRF